MSIFTQSIVLTYFFGICPFIAIPKEISASFGIGAAVIFVMFMTIELNWQLYHLILVPLHIEYLYIIVFIKIIAIFVQIVEIFIDHFSTVLYVSLEMFLLLIKVYCSTLGILLLSVLWSYTYIQYLAFTLRSGSSWTLAIIATADIRKKISFSSFQKGFHATGITKIISWIMSTIFIGFAGIVNL